jgi:hypothetical protein
MHGAVLTVIVAWRRDDPSVQTDGRFWMRVPDGATDAYDAQAGTIVPKGRSLSRWQACATDGECEVANPITGTAERCSLLRWADADPDRTYLIVGFHHRRPDLAGTSDPGHRPGVGIDRPEGDLETRLSGLQSRFRAASARGDGQTAHELGQAIDVAVDNLRRVEFPDHAGGWDLDRAIPAAGSQLILDWTTGY